MTVEGEKPATFTEKADALEARMMDELDVRIAKSVLFTLGEEDPSRPDRGPLPGGSNDPNALALQGDDPRLQKMPKRPTLLDFFTYRFGLNSHLLQSASHAMKAGCNEKTVMACLLHDIAAVGFIRSDHGYWGEQLVAPYVDEEISWSIRTHQALRFYSDESVGYVYPEAYIKLFGEDFKPEPYIEEEYKRALKSPYYMTARMITINDIYSFDSDAKVNIEDFYDIIGRHFRQPKEGLGFDNSPVAHMWRTVIWPTRYL
jgi:hypothetical protein